MKYLMPLLFGAILLTGCGRDESGQTSRHSVYVTTPQAASADGQARLLSGVVEEANGISIGFKTPGQIARLYVKEGDYVRAGQLLAQLDDADYKLGVEALQIQYDQLSEEVGRAKRLFEKNSMSANDFEKASAGLRQLGVQLEANKNKLAYTRLYAPASGYIQSVNFSRSEMVDAGTAVFNLLDVSGMEVVVNIPASLYSASARTAAYACRRQGLKDGAWVPCRFISLVPKADSNQLYRMRLSVDRADAGQLTSGTNVEVSMSLAGASAESTAVQVPVSALFRTPAGEESVWVVSPDSTVTRRTVTVDRSVAGARTVGVTSGLKADERIVRAGVGALTEGEKVDIIAEPSATNPGGLL